MFVVVYYNVLQSLKIISLVQKKNASSDMTSFTLPPQRALTGFDKNKRSALQTQRCKTPVFVHERGRFTRPNRVTRCEKVLFARLYRRVRQCTFTHTHLQNAFLCAQTGTPIFFRALRVCSSSAGMSSPAPVHRGEARKDKGA